MANFRRIIQIETMLILSIAGAYGGAEKSIEIIVRRLTEDYRVMVCIKDDQQKCAFESMNAPQFTHYTYEKGQT